jgi:homopolymeric O-antigen transport system permease protein
VFSAGQFAKVTTAQVKPAKVLEQPWQSVFEHRKLIQLLVRRDLVGRYKGSFGGLFWTIANPLALLFVYWLVFAVIFKVRFGANGTPFDFVLYVIAGLLPWMAFSEALTRANTCIIENVNLVKKVLFPLEVLPINCTLSSYVNSLAGTLLLVGIVLVTRGKLPWTTMLLPFVVLPQLLLTAGIAWFLASFGVFMRDLAHIMGLVLTVWMFLTPIVYPESMVPVALRPILRLNPFTAVVIGYRNLLLDGVLPTMHLWLYLGGVSLAAFILGFHWFIRTKKAFADVI